MFIGVLLAVQLSTDENGERRALQEDEDVLHGVLLVQNETMDGEILQSDSMLFGR